MIPAGRPLPGAQGLPAVSARSWVEPGLGPLAAGLQVSEVRACMPVFGAGPGLSSGPCAGVSVGSTSLQAACLLVGRGCVPTWLAAWREACQFWYWQAGCQVWVLVLLS